MDMPQERIAKMDKKLCLKCEKELLVEGSTVYDGMTLDFNKAGYGSRYDDLGVGHHLFDKDPENLTRLEKALTANVVEAFLCDDCFEKHIDKFRIYKIVTTSKCEEIT